MTNEVAVRRARLTVIGLWAGKPSIYITSHPGRLSLLTSFSVVNHVHKYNIIGHAVYSVQRSILNSRIPDKRVCFLFVIYNRFHVEFHATTGNETRHDTGASGG